MSNLVIPGPADEGDDHSDVDGRGGEQAAGAGGRRRASAIPDAEACLQALAQLAGLVALGVLKPAQANSMRASYREILQYHQKSQARDDRAGLASADLLDRARQDPRLASLLEPFLTDEQIAMIMKDTCGGGRG